MTPKPSKRRKWLLLLLVLFLVVGGGLAAFKSGVSIPGLNNGNPHQPSPAEPVRLKVELVKETPHTLSVPEEVRRSLGIRKGGKDLLAVAEKPTGNRPLILSGSTWIDPANINRIRARFAPAEIVKIETIDLHPKEGTQPRKLQPGDQVTAGQPLAVFNSIEVGVKKNDLIDALVSMKFDQDLLDAAKINAAIPRVLLQTFEKNVQFDRNSINKAESALELWDIPQEDIDAVHREAEEIIKNNGKRDPMKKKSNSKLMNPWNKVVLRAPATGTIVEMNVSEKELVQDPNTLLFQIANVENLLVIAHIPEEDVKELYKVKEALYKSRQPELRWTIRTLGANNSDGVEGPIQGIGLLVDPNTHTVPVNGRIVNKDNILRGGQYITATIELPPPEDVVEVPSNAVVDDGKQAVVFVQVDEKKSEYTLRRVVVTHRFDNRVFVSSKLSERDQQLSPEEEEQGFLPKKELHLGERVLTAGLLELKKELEDRESGNAE